MLSITRQNVNDRMTTRERNVVGSLSAVITAGLLHLRHLLHHVSRLASGCFAFTCAIKQPAYCRVPVGKYANAGQWQSQTQLAGSAWRRRSAE